MPITIGEAIKKKVRDDKRSAKVLSGLLGMTPSNLNKIYKKRSLDTDLVARFCLVFDFDFFDVVNPFRADDVDIEGDLENDLSPTRTPHAKLQRCKAELKDATRELDAVRKEVELLRDYNREKDRVIRLMDDQITDLKRRMPPNV